MKRLAPSQAGLIPLLLAILLFIVGVIVLTYLRVQAVQR
jgi:hypothetical protein